MTKRARRSTGAALRGLVSAFGLGWLRRRLLTARPAADVWSERAESPDAAGARHWTELRQIQDVINRRVSGDPAVDPYQHFIRTRLAGRLPVERALTIGCGGGQLERGLCPFGFASRHDAFDIAPGAVAVARAKAEAEGLHHLRYWVGDGNTVRLERGAYDVVFGVHSIHHVLRLEHLFEEVSRSLKPCGYFFMNEFVGPARFQWTDRQLEVANGLLRTLPESLRLESTDGGLRRRVRRPRPGEVIATDPSEAARSSEILRVAASFFELLEVRPYGGTILQILLEGIAGGFSRPDGTGDGLLQAICDVEWALIAAGDLSSDFAVVVARPKS